MVAINWVGRNRRPFRDGPEALHVSTELAAGLEECLCDLADGTVLHYVHEYLEQVAAFSRDLLESGQPGLCLGLMRLLECIISAYDHSSLFVIRASDFDVEVIG